DVPQLIWSAGLATMYPHLHEQVASLALWTDEPVRSRTIAPYNYTSTGLWCQHRTTQSPSDRFFA
ncbi:MAG: hypothetical protein DWI54_07615, partial [Chloroflexi bacterium]